MRGFSFIRRRIKLAARAVALKLLGVSCHGTTQKIGVGRDPVGGSLVLSVMGCQFDLTEQQAVQLGVTLLVESGAVDRARPTDHLRALRATPSDN